MKKFSFLFLFTILLVGTARSEEPTIEHFTVNHLVYVIEYDGKSVSIAQWDWDSGAVPTGHINIPSTVTYKNKRYTVRYIQSSVFRDCKEITSVTLPSTIESIGAWAFQYCSNLESINIPNSVGGIGKSAFEGCVSLKSIELPNSIGYIDYGTFLGCPFESVLIPNSVTGIGCKAFCECDKLTSVSLSTSLQHIGIGAFSRCEQLRTISLPKSLYLIGEGAFEGCDNLSVINCLRENRQIDVRSIPDYYQTFDGYESPNRLFMLETLDNGSGLQVNGIVADYIENYIPSDVEVYGADNTMQTKEIVSISDNAFVGCKRLTDIYIPASVQYIGQKAFSCCKKLQTIYVPVGAKERFKTILPAELHSKLKEVDFSNIENYKPRIMRIEIDSIPTPSFDFTDEETDEDAILAEFNESQDSDNEPLEKEEQIVEKNEDKVYPFCTQYPMFKGGDRALRKYLQKHIKYPKDAKELGIEGKVIVQFVVQKDGRVENVRVVKGVYPSLDQEAIRVASKLKFIPGKNEKGKPVKVPYMVPVEFTLTQK